MLISVQQIEQEGLHLAGTLAAPFEMATGEQVRLPGPIAFSVRLSRQGDRVDLAGWLSTVVQVNCSRCLVLTPRTVDREFEIRSHPERASPVQEATELDGGDLDVNYYKGGSLDLRAFLAEQVLLDLPMKLLCSDDCRGLCPQCGCDRNRQKCDCEPVGDPRLSPLAELRDRP